MLSGRDYFESQQSCLEVIVFLRLEWESCYKDLGVFFSRGYGGCL